MLTILYPKEMARHLAYPTGTRMLSFPSEARRVLLFKAPKEAIMAAKVQRQLKVYVVGFSAEDVSTVALVFAIFDDHDEPMAVFSPLFAEEPCELMRWGLLDPELEVHFFDDLNHELLGYTASVDMPLETRRLLAGATLLPPAQDLAVAMLDGLPTFMSIRDAEDDALAITITLGEPRFPDDLVYQDTRPSHNSYHGSEGHRFSTLERKEPGRQQEWDIVELLHRVFPANQIYLAPLRVHDKEEITDVLVVTEKRVLMLQAKDSPNTKEMVDKTLWRKRKKALRSLQDALRQVQGAIGYVRSRPDIEMLVDGELVCISMSGRTLYSMAVCRELFNDAYSDYSALLLQTWKKTQVPCIALDYPELSKYTAHLPDEESLFGVYERVFDEGRQNGVFPRIRFS